MENPCSCECPDTTAALGRQRLEIGNSTASIEAELIPKAGSVICLSIDIDTILLAEGRRINCLQTGERPIRHPTTNTEVGLFSDETLLLGSSRLDQCSKEPSKASRLRKLHWWWFWELGGITISVCCMVAILILLPYLDNRSLKDWKFLVAPNTMISTFITVAKTSMLLAVAEGISQLKWHNFKTRKRPLRELDLFDAASRGPWGALVFIIRMAGKPGALFAMLGAFVVVASLTMEPFAQQILSFEGRRVNSTEDVASFSIRRVWNSSVVEGRGQQDLESGFMKGLVSSPAGFQFSCSSGNCTWPNFSALGICASCADTTEKTTTSRDTQSTFNISDGSDVAIDGHPDDCIDMLYVTPAGIQLKMSKGCSYAHRINGDQRCDHFKVGSSTTELVFPRAPAHSGALVKPRNPSSISRQFTSTALISTTPPPSQTFQETKMTISASHIHPIRPKIGVVLTPLVCSEVFQTLPTSISVNTTCSNFKEGEKNSTIAIHAISQTNVTKRGLSGRIVGKAKITECRISWCEKIFQNVQVTNGVMGPMYVANRQLSESELQENIGYLRSWIESGRLNASNVPDAWRYVTDQMTFTDAADGNLKFGPASVISEAATVLEVFENIAEAMTRQLYVGNGSVQQSGLAYTQEVFIVVRWQWAVFPVVLVLLGLVFLAINLWINSRDGVFLWKSSLLPLLFHGLDGYDAEVLDVNENSEMTETAKGMYAKLGRNETGSTRLIST